MNMATMRNRVRAGVLLTLSMVVPLLLVMTNATPALSQATVTVRVSNLDEPSDGYIGLNFDQEYAQSFCTGSVAVTLNKLRMYTRSNGSDSAPVVTIRSDRSGEPSSVLDTLTNPLIDGFHRRSLPGDSPAIFALQIFLPAVDALPRRRSDPASRWTRSSRG